MASNTMLHWEQNPWTLKQSLFFCLPVVKKLSVTFWSCFLEIGHDHIFKAAGLVLSRRNSTRLWIKIPTCIQTGRHRLTHRVGILLAGINPNNRFAYVCRLSNKSFINNCFACKNDTWTINNIFSNFLQKVFISFCEWIELCISRFV